MDVILVLLHKSNFTKILFNNDVIPSRRLTFTQLVVCMLKSETTCSQLIPSVIGYTKDIVGMDKESTNKQRAKRIG